MAKRKRTKTTTRRRSPAGRRRKTDMMSMIVDFVALAAAGGVGYFAAKKASEYGADMMNSDPQMGATLGATAVALGTFFVGSKVLPPKARHLAIPMAAAATIPAIYNAARQFKIAGIADEFMLAGHNSGTVEMVVDDPAEAAALLEALGNQSPMGGNYQSPLAGNYQSPLAGDTDISALRYPGHN